MYNTKKSDRNSLISYVLQEYTRDLESEWPIKYTLLFEMLVAGVRQSDVNNSMNCNRLQRIRDSMRLIQILNNYW